MFEIKPPQNENYLGQSDQKLFWVGGLFSQTCHFTCRRIPNYLTGYKWKALPPLVTVFQKAQCMLWQYRDGFPFGDRERNKMCSAKNGTRMLFVKLFCLETEAHYLPQCNIRAAGIWGVDRDAECNDPFRGDLWEVTDYESSETWVPVSSLGTTNFLSTYLFMEIITTASKYDTSQNLQSRTVFLINIHNIKFAHFNHF